MSVTVARGKSRGTDRLTDREGAESVRTPAQASSRAFEWMCAAIGDGETPSGRGDVGRAAKPRPVDVD